MLIYLCAFLFWHRAQSTKREKKRQLIENKSKHKVADINGRARGLRQTLTILLSIVSEWIEHFSKLWREIQVNLRYFRWSLRMRMRMQFMHITCVHNTKDIDIDAGTFSRYTHTHTHTHYIFLSRFFRFLFCALFFYSFKFWAKKNSIVECAFFVLFSIKWNKKKLLTQSEYSLWFLNGKMNWNSAYFRINWSDRENSMKYTKYWHGIKQNSH